MSVEKKTRSDSPIRKLPPARQAAIMEMMETLSLAQVSKQLAEDGFAASPGTLSEFRSWYLLRQQGRENEQTVETFQEMAREKNPGISEEIIFNFGQTMFSTLAIKQKDALAWSRTQLLRQNEMDLKLRRDKFELEASAKLLDQALRAKADEINSSNLSNAEKIAAMRREAFKSVDELEQSGRIQIPKS